MVIYCFVTVFHSENVTKGNDDYVSTYIEQLAAIHSAPDALAERTNTELVILVNFMEPMTFPGYVPHFEAAVIHQSKVGGDVSAFDDTFAGCEYK